ncbi:TBC1 domain family member 2A isoform X3 [Trematomus bernacchii]|uniref:TBC1 domain family member 2A isoform X3 n=1 Tax=Trematomus bernacchii TaxID=40690 RepID=UPI00146EF94C|nr:TBC1 domain family member 2A isoform X3 [Trematomus bernacchii]
MEGVPCADQDQNHPDEPEPTDPDPTDPDPPPTDPDPTDPDPPPTDPVPTDQHNPKYLIEPDPLPAEDPLEPDPLPAEDPLEPDPLPAEDPLQPDPLPAEDPLEPDPLSADIMKPDDNKPADSQELGPADQNPKEDSPVYISTFTLQISESGDRQDHEDHLDQQYPAPEKPPPTTPEDHQNHQDNQNHQNPQDPSPEKPPSTTPEYPQNHQDLQDLQNHQNHQDHQNPQDLQEHQDHQNPQDLQDLQNHQNHQDHQNPQDLQDLASLSNGAPPAPPRLCGFLQKQGGPLRAWKQRWFRYEESRNQLFYYRTPQDVAPLGRVPLCRASFSYPLQGGGTFHIQTPERTFILKAGSQQLMLYWLQQLQGRRWQHRQTSCDPPSANHTADHFLPVQSPGWGVEATWPPLTNMSLKHPLIHLQNSVHSLRKRSSQECSQSVFHVEAAPPWTPPTPADPNSTTAPMTPTVPLALPPPLSLAEAGQVTRAERRDSSSLLDSWSRRTKRSSSSQRLLQEKEALQEEVIAQKELVWILHRALEAFQLEKRSCAEFLAASGEQERMELLQHRERHAAELQEQLQEARGGQEDLRNSLQLRDAEVAALQDDIRRLTERNNTKQEVIMKLCDQLTSCLSSGGRSDSQSLTQLQQEVENLKDDMEAYRTQNCFLNSELYQLTRLWRTSSQQETSLMLKCSHLEARLCQVESRYLGVLRQLQENKALEPAQQGAVQKMIEDALKGGLKGVIRLDMARDHDEYGFQIVPEYEVEDMKLLAKIQALEIRSHNLLNQLCEKSDASPRPASRQIQLDLHRTLTTNQHFSSPSSPAVQQLRRVLLAFSWQNPAIGYCQGLNRLAGLALLVLQSEEEAFWCLVAVVENILPPDYYTKQLLASQADQRVLKDFLSEKLPRLSAHLQLHSVDVSLVCFNWFLVVFVESLPSDLLLRLWDAFLYEGSKVVFRYALALFKYKEDDILKIQDGVEIHQYLRFFTKTITDGRRLTSIAFSDMNPFPGRLLRNRRVLHLQRLQAELQDLEDQQEEFLTENLTENRRDDKELDVSEDEF